MDRNYKSGAEKRNLKAERVENQQKLLSKIPKLTSIFQTKNSESANNSKSSITDSTAEKDEQSSEASCSEAIFDAPSTSAQTSFSEVSSVSGSDIGSSVFSESQADNSNLFSNDPGLWPVELHQSILQNFWIKKGAGACRNVDAIKKREKHGRQFTEFHFQRVLPNGTKIKRDWLIYSPSAESVFCFVCRLFGDLHGKSNAFSLHGYKNWSNPSRSFSSHEESKDHMKSDVAYKMRVKHELTLEKSFTSITENEMSYWKKVLLRIVEVVRFLSARGLAFCGHDEILGSKHNGNFLGSLELLAKFDPFLQEHISRFGNKGTGRASYLSSKICEEFISIMARSVKDAIISEIINSRYYAFSVDSTPDASHTDQASFCFRYTKDANIRERFLAFIPIEGHTSNYLFDVVIKFHDDNQIDIANCRGQSYDNAFNMAGVYSGLQSLIRQVNEAAIFVPCAAHSLNLVGKNSVSGNILATKFFDLVEKLYGFFVYSPFRWNRLKEQLSGNNEFMLKRATGTRWSVKYEAVHALHSCYLKVLNVLNSFTSQESFSEDSKTVAKGLIRKLCQFNNILMLVLWKSVLTKFNFVNRSLQKSNLTLSVTRKLYDSLLADLESKDYNKIFDEASDIFNTLSCDFQIDSTQTRSMFDASHPEEEKDNLEKSLFEPVLRALISNLKKRAKIYEELDSQYSFLINLNSMTDEEIVTSCKEIVTKYPKDLSEEQLIQECQFAKHYFTFDSLNHESMYKTMFNDNLCTTFPNLDILLRMYLCMFVTNVLDERSFSKLKLIKSYLRNTMTDERLNDLAVLSIESELLAELKFDEIIDKFVALKYRKVVI